MPVSQCHQSTANTLPIFSHTTFYVTVTDSVLVFLGLSTLHYALIKTFKVLLSGVPPTPAVGLLLLL